MGSGWILLLHRWYRLRRNHNRVLPWHLGCVRCCTALRLTSADSFGDSVKSLGQRFLRRRSHSLGACTRLCDCHFAWLLLGTLSKLLMLWSYRALTKRINRLTTGESFLCLEYLHLISVECDLLLEQVVRGALSIGDCHYFLRVNSSTIGAYWLCWHPAFADIESRGRVVDNLLGCYFVHFAPLRGLLLHFCLLLLIQTR